MDGYDILLQKHMIISKFSIIVVMHHSNADNVFEIVSKLMNSLSYLFHIRMA